MTSSFIFILALFSVCLIYEPEYTVMPVASISSRIASLQGRLNDAYERMSDRTDGLIARVDAADQKHANAVDMHNHELDTIEQGVTAIENLARQMSNSPFQNQDQTPDSNGVILNKSR